MCRYIGGSYSQHSRYITASRGSFVLTAIRTMGSNSNRPRRSQLTGWRGRQGASAAMMTESRLFFRATNSSAGTKPSSCRQDGVATTTKSMMIHLLAKPYTSSSTVFSLPSCCCCCRNSMLLQPACTLQRHRRALSSGGGRSARVHAVRWSTGGESTERRLRPAAVCRAASKSRRTRGPVRMRGA